MNDEAKKEAVAAGPVTVVRGRLLCYRIFDIGDEVRLDQAERLLADASPLRRLRLSREGSEYLVFANPPLNVSLGERTLEIERMPPNVEAGLSARFFDYGAASICYDIAIPAGTRLIDLVPTCDALYESTQVEAAARRELDSLLDRVKPAIEGFHRWKGVESYTVIFIEELEGHPPAKLVLDTPGLGKLLLGEDDPKPLAADERADVLKHALSYFQDDLAVIDWNSAFVLEPSGSRDIPEILEFATSQLLELRYYDDLLDHELGEIYDQFAKVKSNPMAVISAPYARLARRALRRWIEITEFAERVENAVKVVGDLYLARVYRSAVQRFQNRSWQGSVDTKLSLVAQVYTLLNDELNARRNVILELAIVVLFLFEIIKGLL